MLIFTRKVGERIVIQTTAGNVTVTVTDIHTSYCRVGVEAPQEIPVHREEVVRRIEAGATRQEVQAELARLGIDTGPAFARVKEALEKRRETQP